MSSHNLVRIILILNDTYQNKNVMELQVRNSTVWNLRQVRSCLSSPSLLPAAWWRFHGLGLAGSSSLNVWQSYKPINKTITQYTTDS